MNPTRRDRSVWLVVVGGAAGSLVRHGVSELPDPDQLFPVATFAVNITGAFALGMLLTVLTLSGDDTGRPRASRLLLGTGFLGGYTTYSALAAETQALLRDDHVALGLTYGVGSVLLGLVAALAGVAAGRMVRR